MKIIDAHAHYSIKYMQEIKCNPELYAVMTASEPSDCEQLLEKCSSQSRIVPCFGIHPWQSERLKLSCIAPYVPQGRAIGEIGMDSIWCNVPLCTQRRAFLEQLELAEKLKLPVILHTKGCEEEILAHMQGLTVPVLLHWYSDSRYQEQFIALDCYFTIGPDLADNDAVKKLAMSVPLDRIMLETDGLDGLNWAQASDGCNSGSCRRISFYRVLDEAAGQVARLRDISKSLLLENALVNAAKFFSIPLSSGKYVALC